MGESSKVSYLTDFCPCICGSHILVQNPFVSCELKVWYRISSVICGKFLKNNGVLRRQPPFAVNDLLGWAQHSKENPVTLTLLCGRFESSGLPFSAVCLQLQSILQPFQLELQYTSGIFRAEPEYQPQPQTSKFWVPALHENAQAAEIRRCSQNRVWFADVDRYFQCCGRWYGLG